MWIEISSISRKYWKLSSRPARALWIEIVKIAASAASASVEAREGLVD